MEPNPLRPLVFGMLAMLVLSIVFLSVRDAANEAISQAEKDRAEEIAAKENERREEERYKAEQESIRAEAVAAEARDKEEAAREARKPPLDVGVAYQRLLGKAEAGDAYAQAVIGEIIYFGIDRILTPEMNQYSGVLLGPEFLTQRGKYRLANLPRLPPADEESAFPWFLRSAQQGNAYGMSGLRNAYMLGRGITMDRVEAFKWAQLLQAYAKDTEAGRRPPYDLLEPVFRPNPVGLYEELTPQQKAEVERRATAFKAKKETP